MKEFHRKGKYEGWIGFDWKSFGLGISTRWNRDKQIAIYLPFFEFNIDFYGKKDLPWQYKDWSYELGEKE